jgi:hypothetical protein
MNEWKSVDWSTISPVDYRKQSIVKNRFIQLIFHYYDLLALNCLWLRWSNLYSNCRPSFRKYSTSCCVLILLFFPYTVHNGFNEQWPMSCKK